MKKNDSLWTIMNIEMTIFFLNQKHFPEFNRIFPEFFVAWFLFKKLKNNWLWIPKFHIQIRSFMPQNVMGTFRFQKNKNPIRRSFGENSLPTISGENIPGNIFLWIF